MARKNSCTPTSLIQASIHVMGFVGCSPKKRNLYSIILCYMICLIILSSFLFQGIYLATTHYANFGSAMIDIILFDGFWQLFMKIYIVFSKHILLSKLIDTINNKFWSHNDLKENERNKIQSIYNITQASIKFYKITVLFNVLGHYITAYLKGNGNLIMNIWFPQSIQQYVKMSPHHEIVFAVQSLIMGIPVMTVYIEIDTIFIITFAASLAQLKMLKYKINSLRHYEDGKKLDVLVNCCNHHAMILQNETLDLVLTDMFEAKLAICDTPLIGEDLYHPSLEICFRTTKAHKEISNSILHTEQGNAAFQPSYKCEVGICFLVRFFSDMEAMFSTNMLQMLGTSGLIAVVALYSTLTEQNIIRITEYLFMVTGVACQLFVFCLIGQIIQDENLSIAETAYNCYWEDISNEAIRKTLMMIIMRSQKHVNITMGGFAILCLETFSKITQTMMSFLTFMLSFTDT